MPDAYGLTVKELVLRVEGKIDGYIAAHEARHGGEAAESLAARSDASASAAGRELQRAITEVATDVLAVTATVSSHDRTIQRLTGALALLTTLGIGTLGLVILRIAGITP